jgi:hypothetical protein
MREGAMFNLLADGREWTRMDAMDANGRQWATMGDNGRQWLAHSAFSGCQRLPRSFQRLFSDTELVEDRVEQIVGGRLAHNLAHCLDGSAQIHRDQIEWYPAP